MREQHETYYTHLTRIEKMCESFKKTVFEAEMDGVEYDECDQAYKDMAGALFVEVETFRLEVLMNGQRAA